MPATAANLRDLHLLHQRAKALRDRLESSPKTLATREKVLATRQAALEDARKVLKDTKAHAKSRETQIQSIQAKSDELRVKLNSAKKQVDYDAIRNQIAHDTHAIGKLEDDTLETYTKIEEQTTSLTALEADVKALADEVARLRDELSAQAEPQRAQLRELEEAITAAEDVIPEGERDQYRRIVKQRGPDALAAAEGGACTGCNVSVTAQTVNELINGGHIIFCKTCGRILYLAEEEVSMTRRSGR